jgi:hypothetical protein
MSDGLVPFRKCKTDSCYNEKEFNKTNTGRLQYCIFCLLEMKKTKEKGK